MHAASLIVAWLAEGGARSGKFRRPASSLETAGVSHQPEPHASAALRQGIPLDLVPACPTVPHLRAPVVPALKVSLPGRPHTSAGLMPCIWAWPPEPCPINRVDFNLTHVAVPLLTAVLPKPLHRLLVSLKLFSPSLEACAGHQPTLGTSSEPCCGRTKVCPANGAPSEDQPELQTGLAGQPTAPGAATGTLQGRHLSSEHAAVIPSA